MRFAEVAVTAYAGYKQGEYPRAFTFQGRQVRIAKVVDRWYEGTPQSGSPYHNYFKVQAEDGRQYVLRYNGLFDVWSLMVSD
jgi:hypothetical protein